MPKHRETSVVSSLEKAHPVRLQAAGSDPYAAVRPYYALHASARNKGLCPHSDNHQLRWWMCSLFLFLAKWSCHFQKMYETVPLRGGFCVG